LSSHFAVETENGCRKQDWESEVGRGDGILCEAVIQRNERG